MEQPLVSSDSINHRPATDAKTIFWLVGVSAVVLFLASSIRHLLFQSTAFDLGYFDQPIYLISQGQPPIVSFWGFHFLGRHADWILYLLAPLYKLYPSVFWLFAIQAIAHLKTTGQTTGSVLTNPQAAPHLTHRPVVQLATDQFKVATLNDFNYVLLDTCYAGMSCSKAFMASLISQLQQSSTYQLAYQRDDVYLFVKAVDAKP